MKIFKNKLYKNKFFFERNKINTFLILYESVKRENSFKNKLLFYGTFN